MEMVRGVIVGWHQQSVGTELDFTLQQGFEAEATVQADHMTTLEDGSGFDVLRAHRALLHAQKLWNRDEDWQRRAGYICSGPRFVLQALTPPKEEPPASNGRWQQKPQANGR